MEEEEDGEEEEVEEEEQSKEEEEEEEEEGSQGLGGVGGTWRGEGGVRSKVSIPAAKEMNQREREDLLDIIRQQDKVGGGSRGPAALKT